MQENSTSNTIARKRLILRLSSLGDVILSASALETAESSAGVDWVVAKEYAAVLRGHPRIRKLWEFDRRQNSGLLAWKVFAQELWDQNYTEVIDLHGSIRTRILRFFFVYWSFRNSVAGPHWTVASKQRFRSWGFILFKKLWPKFWLSRLQVEIFARAAGGTGQERPNMRHLLSSDDTVSSIPKDAYICVMPGSSWPGKTWAAEKYLEVLKELQILPVIMGTTRDPESVSLVRLLEVAGIPHVSGVGKWDLQESARVLAKSAGYLGSDTGLALLSEALGVEIVVIYGPTAPGLGFEPWRNGSRTIGSGLWCRPCGKIGHRCYRPKDKFLCLKGLTPSEVLPVVANKCSKDGKYRVEKSGNVSTERNSLRLSARAYFWLWENIIEPWVLPRKMGAERIEAGTAAIKLLSAIEPRKNSQERVPRFWFHAASVGELESLWPLTVELLKSLQIDSKRPAPEFILTAFSSSAGKSVLKLGELLGKTGGTVLYCGLSPWEGHWKTVMKSVNPDIFITAKYEAWPELWMSQAELKIPLTILGARSRKSLRMGKRLCESMGFGLPRMLLLPVLENETQALRRDFPGARIESVGEPRWDRVMERSQTGHARAKLLLSCFHDFPRPWGICGSIWPEDVAVWGDLVLKNKGTLWIVPHKIDSDILNELYVYFSERGLKVIRTSLIETERDAREQWNKELTHTGNECVLVDEMGFLSELYSAADWAYVGGGFGAGVHSTIEPAIHGIPIASGPARAERFSEIQQLSGSGQLRIIRSTHEFQNWFHWQAELKERNREAWNRDVKSYLGASARAAQALLEFSKGT